jgi:Domain of unknown function (DUF4124)
MIRALLLWLVLLPLPAMAQQMYKWVDEKGVTHFSESPPPDGNATKVEVRPTGTERPRTDNWKDRELESRQRRAQKETAEEETRRKEDSTREQRCSHAREGLDTVKNSRRVYSLDEKGERVYMEDKDRPAAIEKWSQDVGRYCR